MESITVNQLSVTGQCLTDVETCRSDERTCIMVDIRYSCLPLRVTAISHGNFKKIIISRYHLTLLSMGYTDITQTYSFPFIDANGNISMSVSENNPIQKIYINNVFGFTDLKAEIYCHNCDNTIQIKIMDRQDSSIIAAIIEF